MPDTFRMRVSNIVNPSSKDSERMEQHVGDLKRSDCKLKKNLQISNTHELEMRTGKRARGRCRLLANFRTCTANKPKQPLQVRKRTERHAGDLSRKGL